MLSIPQLADEHISKLHERGRAVPLAVLHSAVVLESDASLRGKVGIVAPGRTLCPLSTHGLEASMSRTGNPYDNATVESLFSTPKTECLHRHTSSTRLETQAIAFDYIETFYNRTRLHSALGYQSPVDFENINL